MNKKVAVVGSKLGNWQEYTTVDAKQAFPITGGVTDEQAVMSFVNPVTAYVMIREVLKCRSGDVVLQSAANSELGKMIIKMGKEYGFQTINLIRSKEQAEGLKSLGADHVIDISTQDLRKEIFNITNGKGAPYALDPVAGSLASEMVQCLGLNGRMLVYGTLSSELLNFSSRDLMTPLSSVEGFFLTNWMGAKGLLKKLSITKKVDKLVKSGVLQSQVNKVFPMDQYQDAIAAVKHTGNQGKILLRLGGSE